MAQVARGHLDPAGRGPHQMEELVLRVRSPASAALRVEQESDRAAEQSCAWRCPVRSLLHCRSSFECQFRWLVRSKVGSALAASDQYGGAVERASRKQTENASYSSQE